MVEKEFYSLCIVYGMFLIDDEVRMRYSLKVHYLRYSLEVH